MADLMGKNAHRPISKAKGRGRAIQSQNATREPSSEVREIALEGLNKHSKVPIFQH